MKNSFKLIAAVLALIFMSANVQDMMAKKRAGSKKTEVKDLVLIYNGGAHRSTVWNKEMFAPYVSLPDENGKQQWLFDGFLFLEIKNGKGRGFASYYEKLAARQSEWKALIDGYFTPGNAICALDECIQEVKPNATGRFTKRKIVLSIPEPIPNVTDWGEVDGRALDFSKKEDRLAACKWFIDYAMAKFKESKLKNVEISGFYWLAEEATNSRDLALDVSHYVQSKKKSFNWIPYFKSDGFNEWKELGFTQAFLQPNHFFNEKIPYSRLEEAFKLASENGMSVEMEFDERALKKGGFGYRMRDYIRAFKESGAMDHLDVAYYQGDNAFYALAKSAEPEDRALYLELAQIIAKRQKEKTKKK